MLLFIRIFLVLYGIIASTTTPMADNNHRFVAAIWASMSLAFFYVAWVPSETALFRFLMIAVFIGGLVRLYGLRYYPASPFLIFGILIELIPTALMFWMHNKLFGPAS
jgi:hypothetical protein